MNWKMVMFRGIQAPIGLIGLALCGWAASWWLRATPLGPIAIDAMRYGFPTLLGAACVSYLYFVYRLFRWERTAGDQCCERCSGPTGWCRIGRVYRGRQLPDFRICYHCGKKNPQPD